eukprot:1547330-Alexandrium_andersonii.AAC.1
MAQPRDAGEADLARSLLAGLLAWECRLLPVGVTRRGGGGGASLDLVAAPAGEAWRWSATVSPGGSLSDHSVLVAGVDE